MVCRQVMEMIDYEEMYYKMVRASEQAINMLIQAQRECEELYLNARETPVVMLPGRKTGGDDAGLPTSTKIK